MGTGVFERTSGTRVIDGGNGLCNSENLHLNLSGLSLVRLKLGAEEFFET
jgi:hypothetical protein